MDDGSWHLFDDSHVSPVEESRVQSPAAYVLFFRRQHEAERDPGLPLTCSCTPIFNQCCTEAGRKPHSSSLSCAT
jgi:hypothetical protein